MEFYTIGGFNEVGKNMSVLKLNEDDSLIFDCGLFIPALIENLEKEAVYNETTLREAGAVPDDFFIDSLGMRKSIRAILVTHAHLDHVGAIPYLSYRYNCPVIGTPFTIEVLNSLIEDTAKGYIPNQIKPVSPNSSTIIKGKNKNYEVEFINMTHSTIQTAIIAVHTDKGVVIYANDFKFDNNPILGKKPNYERLKELGKEGVLALIVDSLYSGEERKTPSEKIARAMLEEVLLTVENSNSGIIVTTFSSHIARIKSIVDFAKQLNRKIIVLGRSMSKYIKAADKIQSAPFIKDINIATYRNQVERYLKQISKSKKDYLVICTGHQGEPGSILDRIAKGQLNYKIDKNDQVIFSSRVIPTTSNLLNRQNMEKFMKQKGARIFSDIHTSGHCAKEDLRDLINILNPQHIIPAHGDLQKLTNMVGLAKEMGYKLGKNCHLMQNHQKTIF